MKLIFYFSILIFIFISSVFAKENNYYLSLKNSKVNVRYGPRSDSPIKYIYTKKNLPVKIIDKKENFRRIIAFKNNSGWIHVSQLKKNKSFILLKDEILFSKPTRYSKPILKILNGRLLIIKKCNSKWCKVKTENYLGWVQINKVWGYIN